jgi:hypothetical protein
VKRRRWAYPGVALAALVLGAAFLIAGGPQHSRAAAAHGTGIASASSNEPDRAAAQSFKAVALPTSFGPNVVNGIYDGESPAVSSLPVLPVQPITTIVTRDNESVHPAQGQQDVKDPVVQSKRGTAPIAPPIQNFDGACLPFGTPTCAQASNCSCLPPDTNGAAGLTQYTEMVNSSFVVYSKTGAVLRPATEINQLWANTGSECAKYNDGDPVVVYDQLANRWLLSQFIARPTGSDQYGECIAVSKTSDATGGYYLYTFLFGTNVFYDYPHIGVWPDGYYMTANEFPSNTLTSAGTGAFAFERSQMLQGLPARVVFFDESQHNPVGGQYIGQLAGTLDGRTLPPTGAPNVFAEVDDPSSIPPQGVGDTGFDMRLWNFHVDWANPANSTFGQNGDPNATLPVAPFVRNNCVYGHGDCVPQKGGPEQLDVLGDRLMFRLPIRYFGTTPTMLVNHTVTAKPVTGVRWYEVRNPSGSSASIRQQGTYAPTDTTDPLWRWMGSIAMDHVGNIALGYSASGPADYPSVRYTGRLASDPLGQMTQTEHVVWTGGGPQTQVEGRWGDYSAMTIDPTDDCTFWYTQEYLGTDLVFGAWRTRIASFKFPGCR